jgi:hypothetical protein
MPGCSEFTAIMTNDKPQPKQVKKPLDTHIENRGRGRPWKVRASEVAGRSLNFRGILESVWERIWPSLSQATNETELIGALQKANPYERELTPIAPLIFEVVKAPNFPKRQRPQINFLADSIAALGTVTPRRSRDICARERAREERAHHVLRFEFYIECSCRYKGHSKDHACPRCGAKIEFPIHLGSDFL